MLNNNKNLKKFKRKYIFILTSILISIFSFILNKIIHNKLEPLHNNYLKENLNEFNKELKKLQNLTSTNIDTNSNIYDIAINNSNDLNYILNYKGGDLEPEWQWVKNISIVYTWVDGSDVDFLELKSKFNGGIKKVNSRDRSADELRYSLRSLEEYMPWHQGTIYIVTSQQVPKWLNTNNKRIKMIYHKNIFPKYIYPTYDSNTIEMFFDKIPGITERFLYFNDDVFLNNYIHPCFFFTSKNFYPKVYRNIIRHINEKEVERIIKNNDIHEIFQASKYFTRETIREYFDNQFEFRDLFHTVHVFYRDLFEPFRKLFLEELKNVFANRFRHPTKIQTIYLYQAFMQYATQHKEFPLKLGGNGKVKYFKGHELPVNKTIKKYSCEIVSPTIANKFIKFGKISDNSRKNNKYFNLYKNNPNIYIYNLNDAYSQKKSLYEFTEYMITRYPKPSLFEKKDFVSLEKYVSSQMESIDNNLNKIVNSISSDFKRKNIMIFKMMMNKYKMNIIKDYINKKKDLIYPATRKKIISKSEKKDMISLLKYNGDELSDEWKWAKNISFVYFLKGITNKNKNRFSFINNFLFRKNELSNNDLMNELKYSLRSLEKYLPWHQGKIYIITETQNLNQFPWLNYNHNRIKIIYQNEIIPKNYQNNNKQAIEMFLDKIPDLSERFIYIQPHHYFKNYTHPCFFFNNNFFPKYNFKDVIEIETLDKLTKNSFEYTHNIILHYFGNNYIKTYRHFEDVPIPLYRDLFEPTREVFRDIIKKSFKYKYFRKFELLPLYLVVNYNIYGTSQPFYPNYLVGYGKIQEIQRPVILNKNRTIEYYGFDITSKNVDKYTILIKSFLYDPKINNCIMKKILFTNKLFFSLLIENQEKLTINNQINLKKLMKYLFKEKSSFEI
ncbi:hypothetical protein H8356DRAFT_1292099 [Neocallimastix lanati (nom. inval.)]|nr:hypothetical protein H8356DRAFT_1292099 [Neocallimastix sp. JGI-2020a]